jgi:MFS family permease
MIWGYRERKRQAGERHLDVLGALLLTAAIAGLLLGLGAGSATAKPNWPIAAGGLVLAVLFVLFETRVKLPVVPLDLLRSRIVGPALGVGVIAGTLMFGVTAYVPLFVQDAIHQSAFAAGAAAAPLSLGWPIGSVLAGRLLLKVGYERLLAAGSVALVIGALLLALVTRTPPAIGGAAAVMGLGMGLLSTPILIVIQSSVEHGRRGAATALNQLSRTLGGAVGVGLMGILIEGRHGAAALETGIVSVFWVIVALACASLLACSGILVLARSRRPA